MLLPGETLLQFTVGFFSQTTVYGKGKALKWEMLCSVIPLLLLPLHHEGACYRAGRQASWRARKCHEAGWSHVSLSHTALSITTQSTPAFQTHPLALQRYQGLSNFYKELLELGFRFCSSARPQPPPQ